MHRRWPSPDLYHGLDRLLKRAVAELSMLLLSTPVSLCLSYLFSLELKMRLASAGLISFMWRSATGNSSLSTSDISYRMKLAKNLSRFWSSCASLLFIICLLSRMASLVFVTIVRISALISCCCSSKSLWLAAYRCR